MAMARVVAACCLQCEVSGAVVGGLQVCARREQYEQLLDTLKWISVGAAPAPPSPHPQSQPTLPVRSIYTLLFLKLLTFIIIYPFYPFKH